VTRLTLPRDLKNVRIELLSPGVYHHTPPFLLVLLLHKTNVSLLLLLLNFLNNPSTK